MSQTPGSEMKDLRGSDESVRAPKPHHCKARGKPCFRDQEAP